jgi:hypothetical protein
MHGHVGFMTDAWAQSRTGTHGNQSHAGRSEVGVGSGHGSVDGRLVSLCDGPMGPSPRQTNSLTDRANHANRPTRVRALARALATEWIGSVSHPRARLRELSTYTCPEPIDPARVDQPRTP